MNQHVDNAIGGFSMENVVQTGNATVASGAGETVACAFSAPDAYREGYQDGWDARSKLAASSNRQMAQNDQPLPALGVHHA